jgi:hypothetical protein
MLIRRDCGAYRLGAPIGGLSVEIDGVIGIVEGGIQVRGPPIDRVRVRKRLELLWVSADENRVNRHPAPISQVDSAVLHDGRDRAIEVLTRPHPASHAIHDYPNPQLTHRRLRL